MFKKVTCVTCATLHINLIGDFERFFLNSLLLPLMNFAKDAIILCKSLCRTIYILLQVQVCTYALLYSCPTRTNHIKKYYLYILAKSSNRHYVFIRFFFFKTKSNLTILFGSTDRQPCQQTISLKKDMPNSIHCIQQVPINIIGTPFFKVNKNMHWMVGKF